MNIRTQVREFWPNSDEFAVVEHKGLGHPDTLADGIAEVADAAYSNLCLRYAPAVLHHNFDKVYIGAGLIVPQIGAASIPKARVQVRISEVKGINRVCLDISSKPPSAIEWE